MVAQRTQWVLRSNLPHFIGQQPHTRFGPTSPSSGVSCNTRTKKRNYHHLSWIEYPFTPEYKVQCPVPGLLNFQSHSLHKDTLKATLKIHENHQVSTCLTSVFETTTLDVSNPIVNVKEQMNVFGDEGKSRWPINDFCVGLKDSWLQLQEHINQGDTFDLQLANHALCSRTRLHTYMIWRL